MPDPITTILALAGGATAATVLTLWYSPYLCRLFAAALLTHAATVETARDFRRQEWDRQSEALEVRR